MVEVLVRVVLETKHVMHWVIEVAPDASTPHAGRFRFQIEHLPDHASFPEQARIEPGTVSFQRVLVGRDHPQTEAPIAGDVLETRHLLGGLLDIRVDEAVQLQVQRAPDGTLPPVSVGECFFKRGSL